MVGFYGISTFLGLFYAKSGFLYFVYIFMIYCIVLISLESLQFCCSLVERVL